MTINKIPDKYWLYPFAVLAVIFIILHFSNGFVSSVGISIVGSAIITGYTFLIYTLWVGEGKIYKILAVILSPVLVLLVIVIQYLYEKKLLKKENVELKQVGDAS